MPTMKKLWIYYCNHALIEVLVAFVPYTVYVIAWFEQCFLIAGLSFYGIWVALTAILAASVKHRLAKDSKTARLSLDVFCVMFLLAFFTILVLSPLSFRGIRGR
jgi:hypothetical protein